MKLFLLCRNLKKQYAVSSVVDYRSTELERYIRDSQTVFMYNVPVEYRTDIMRWSYKYKVNVYFNPEIEDIMELNAEQYVLDDVFLLNKKCERTLDGTAGDETAFGYWSVYYTWSSKFSILAVRYDSGEIV